MTAAHAAGDRAGMTAIDVHTHVVPERLKEFIRADGDRLGIRIERNGDQDVLVTRHYTGPASGPYSDLAHRRADMQAVGVAKQILSLPAAVASPWLDPARGAELARRANDALAEIVRADPEHFQAFGMVPLRDGERAAREVERARSIGLSGILVPTGIDGGPLDLAELEPFYAGAAATRMVMFVHPTGPVIGAERLARHGLQNAVGFPVDVAVAAIELMVGGVLDRHRDLRVLLAHGGGALLALLPRLENARGSLRELVARFTFDTVVHEPSQLGRLIETVGAERVAFGTDYPSELGDPAGRVARAVLAPLPPAVRERVLAGRARELLVPGSP